MGESRDKVIKAIKHYQDSLERHSKTKKSDKLLHAIERLSSLPIRVWHLEETGVGRTVNGLKRYEGEVGESARNLVDKWKCMVKDEEEEELAKQEKHQEIDEPGEPDEEALQIAEPPEEVNGNSRGSESPKLKKRRRSEERNERERSSKKSKSSHHNSNHKQRKRSESEDSNDSDSSDSAPPPTKSKSHKSKKSRSSEDSSSDNSSRSDNSDSESSQSDSKHGKLKESSKHSKDAKHKHHSKDKSSSNSKKPEPERKHKESSSSRHKDKSDKENVSSKDRSSVSKSSSSSKHKHSNSDKEKSRSSDKNRKSSSKRDSQEKQAEKVSKPKIHDTEQLVNGIDSGSGASFADALGMLEAPVPLKSKKKKVISCDVKASSSKSATPMKESRGSEEPKKSSEVPNLLKSPEELEPLSINDLSSLLPSITPNYRPLGLPVEHHRKGWTDEEALSRVISAKHQRTKVYSGNKSMYTKVPTLFDICSRVLQDNLDALEYTGGVPYTILKHILEKANPNQLYQLEFHNPYLIEDTDDLWQLHCQKEFRNAKREEMETWRDMYMRCLDERDARLKALTANIKQSQDKSIPVRQTKLAYVDSVVKPPRNIARKQAKNGIIDFKKPSQTPSERLSQLAKAGEASKVSVPNPGRAAADRSGSSSSHHSNLKPKKAPLMAKTLSLLKNRFGRR